MKTARLAVCVLSILPAVLSGAADRKVILVNATGKAGLYAKLPERPRMIRVFDVTGCETRAEIPSAGLVSLPVPASGYAELAW